jgi:hypothetical protein
MRYPDGQLARLGDRLRLWDGVERTIVCSLNTDEYSAAYPRSEWNCLKTGVLVHSAQAGRHVEHRVPRLRLDLCDTGAHALVAPLFGLTLLQRRHWTERPLPEVVRVAILQTLSTIISF